MASSGPAGNVEQVGRMSASEFSLFAFGFYSIALGLTLMIVPNWLFGLVGLPPTQEVWIRVAGMLLFCLGIYYILAGRKGLTSLIRLSVYTRASVILFFTAFVLFGLAKPVVILLGVVDLTAAIWTAVALRWERAIRPGSG
jgi:hypothetical protein